MIDDHILVETGDFFLHRTRVGRIATDRGDYCRNLAAGRKVLHIGCVDSPIFNPQSNLYLLLEPVCEIDGLDSDVAGLAELARHARGRLFSDFSEVTGAYDLVLVPEVIEHVANHAEFIAALDPCRSGRSSSRCLVLAMRSATTCSSTARGRGFTRNSCTPIIVHGIHPSPCTRRSRSTRAGISGRSVFSGNFRMPRIATSSLDAPAGCIGHGCGENS